ncbi:flavin monoamine oxidase family protein [Roseicyclus marinus]|uniref:flavin monoamine oxidase family protein n=1 Tax=Roseicyclus marinus TaxID=2161673 RepID=UPI00240FD226|nr:NAD(P)/FAD-dependent oxidoreductase [Roseicyclus marinus]MDG3041720.1 FAD-dependent oxidoreductase [Roseicyclus marinus]
MPNPADLSNPGRRACLGLLAGAVLAAPRIVRADPLLDVDVVVIGAGSAGISAARQLIAWDYEVAVLEARGRIGGRAWTDPGALGLPWDRGAQWLHNGGDNPLRQLARDLGLGLTASDFEDMSATGTPLDPRAAAERLLANLETFDAALDAMADRIAPGATLAALFGGDSWQDAALRLSCISLGGDPDQVSLADAIELASGQDWLVEGGTGGLLTRLAAGLPIRTSHAVTRIDLGAAGHVAVSGDFGTIRAGQVVLTVPPAVLATGGIRFTPDLPAAHHDALAALEAAEFLKVGFRLLRQPADMAEFQLDLSRLDAGEGELVHLDPRAPVASVIFSGRHARALRTAGAGAVIAEAAEVLRDQTGLSAETSAWHDWSADPHSRGPWALPRPGAEAAREIYATAIQNRLFMAGEAAPGPLAQTLGGAWVSGQAAAAAIWEVT